jgi:hypothetical protein
MSKNDLLQKFLVYPRSKHSRPPIHPLSCEAGQLRDNQQEELYNSDWNRSGWWLPARAKYVQEKEEGTQHESGSMATLVRCPGRTARDGRAGTKPAHEAGRQAGGRVKQSTCVACGGERPNDRRRFMLSSPAAAWRVDRAPSPSPERIKGTPPQKGRTPHRRPRLAYLCSLSSTLFHWPSVTKQGCSPGIFLFCCYTLSMSSPSKV